MTSAAPSELRTPQSGLADVGFAVAIVAILAVLFLPLPPALIDVGLAISIALSIVILMVAIGIGKPLEFSAFPTILLIATMLRLSLNIATTRVILQHGAEGHDAAGYVIAGFATILMGGDFVIGCVVFLILVIVNFIVITKGATRIAEVGARFSLDAMPGKQMAIDADLAAGSIDEKTANRRRQELEEESAFFGAMDGASKFVRGDAIAGLVITGVNIFGGVLIGVIRHGMPFDQALDVFMRLSVGDGLVTQIPALIVSLAAGLLVSKGGTRGPAQDAVVGQLGSYPQALYVSGGVMALLGLVPGLPMLPFACLGCGLVWAGINAEAAKSRRASMVQAASVSATVSAASVESAAVQHPPDLEIIMGRPLAANLLRNEEALPHRMGKLRRKFMRQYGLAIPDVHLSDDLEAAPDSYVIRLHGATVASGRLRLGEVLVLVGDGSAPDVPGDEVREAAFGTRALWCHASFTSEIRRQGFEPIDVTSVLLTHVAEVIRGQLGPLLSYKSLRALLDRQDPAYKKLLDDIVPTHISYSGVQSVLKALLQERVSIRSLPTIIEAIAEVAPFMRKIDSISEHVRGRLAQQLCADLSSDGVLKLVRISARWDVAIQAALKRDARGDIVEFDMDPKDIEQFGNDLSTHLRRFIDSGQDFCLVSSSAARPYVRMMVERLFPSVSVLAHSELARGIPMQTIGSIG